jgi:hypothetical protein
MASCSCARSLAAEQLVASLQHSLEAQRQLGLEGAAQVDKALQHRALIQTQTEEMIAEFQRERAELMAELLALRKQVEVGGGGGGGGGGVSSPAAAASGGAEDQAELLASAKTRASEADAKARAAERQLKEERDASAKRAARVKALEDQLRAQGEEHQARTAALGAELAKHTGTLARLGEEKAALEERLQRLSEAVAPKAEGGALVYALVALLAVLAYFLLAARAQAAAKV